jgi:hypothetical protein
MINWHIPLRTNDIVPTFKNVSVINPYPAKVENMVSS